MHIHTHKNIGKQRQIYIGEHKQPHAKKGRTQPNIYIHTHIQLHKEKPKYTSKLKNTHK